MEADGREEREEEDHGVAWYVVDRNDNGLDRAIIRPLAKMSRVEIYTRTHIRG
jgi:hypothetical protein